MSVQKYILSKDSSSFTILPNKVLQGVKNGTALGIYCYLSSLPPDWEFYKECIQKHFGIGRKKLDGIFKLLEAHNLISVIQMRNEKGHFGDWKLHVCDGNNFVEIQEDMELSPPLVPNGKPVTVVTEKNSYKRNNNKRNKTNKSSTPNVARFVKTQKSKTPEKKYDREAERKIAMQAMEEIKNKLGIREINRNGRVFVQTEEGISAKAFGGELETLKFE